MRALYHGHIHRGKDLYIVGSGHGALVPVGADLVSALSAVPGSPYIAQLVLVRTGRLDVHRLSLFRFTRIRKPLYDCPIDFNRILPHGERTHPNAARAVKRLVNHHFRKRFTVFGDADYLIVIAFIVAVYTRWNGMHIRVLTLRLAQIVAMPKQLSELYYALRCFAKERTVEKAS